MQRNADEASLHILGDGGTYNITLWVRTTAEPIDIDHLMAKMVGQVGMDHPSAEILEQKPTKMLDKPAGAIYVRIPDSKRGPWILGQTFALIQDNTYVLLEFETMPTHLQMTTAIFEAIVASMKIEDPKKIDQDRIDMIEGGVAWRANVRNLDLQQAIVAQQWLRILLNNSEVGYMHVAQRTGRQMDANGICVNVDAHMEYAKKVFESTSQFFVSDDDTMEVWSIKTSSYPQVARGMAPNPLSTSTITETGIRSKTKITVNRDTGAARKEYNWDLALPREFLPNDQVQHLEKNYLSQVELWLIPHLLPIKDPRPYGFYAYYSNAHKLAFRTVRVEAQSDGGYIVYSRPTPEAPEQVSHFNAAGMLVEQEIPGGETLKPASKDEIRAQWNVE